MKLLTWLFVAASSLSLMGLNPSLSADEFGEGPHEIDYSPAVHLTTDQQALWTHAFNKEWQVVIQPNPETGVIKIIVGDIKPRGTTQASYADQVILMRQMVAANPQSLDFAYTGERMANDYLKNNPESPEGTALRMTSLLVQTGMKPAVFTTHPDFMKWAAENHIASAVNGFHHKWVVGHNYAPVIVMPSGKIGWSSLKKQGIVDQNGNFAKGWAYTNQGFVQVATPAAKEPEKEADSIYREGGETPVDHGEETPADHVDHAALDGGSENDNADNNNSENDNENFGKGGPGESNPGLEATFASQRVIHDESAIESLSIKSNKVGTRDSSCQDLFDQSGSLGADCKIVSKTGKNVTIHDPDARSKLESTSNNWIIGATNADCESQWTENGVLLASCKLLNRKLALGSGEEKTEVHVVTTPQDSNEPQASEKDNVEEPVKENKVEQPAEGNSALVIQNADLAGLVFEGDKTKGQTADSCKTALETTGALPAGCYIKAEDEDVKINFADHNKILKAEAAYGWFNQRYYSTPNNDGCAKAFSETGVILKGCKGVGQSESNLQLPGGEEKGQSNQDQNGGNPGLPGGQSNQDQNGGNPGLPSGQPNQDQNGGNPGLPGGQSNQDQSGGNPGLPSGQPNQDQNSGGGGQALPNSSHAGKDNLNELTPNQITQLNNEVYLNDVINNKGVVDNVGLKEDQDGSTLLRTEANGVVTVVTPDKHTDVKVNDRSAFAGYKVEHFAERHGGQSGAFGKAVCTKIWNEKGVLLGGCKLVK